MKEYNTHHKWEKWRWEKIIKERLPWCPFLSQIFSLGVIMTYPTDGNALSQSILISVSMGTHTINVFLVAGLKF